MPRTADSLPFGPTGPFLETEDRLEALSRMLFTAEERRPLAVVTGPTGIGKSRLLKEFGRQLRYSHRLVREVSLAGVTRVEFPRVCLAACGSDQFADADWSVLEDVIVGHGLAGDGGVWLFDEFDSASELGPALHRLQRWLQGSAVQGTMVIATADLRRLGTLRELLDWPIVLRSWSHADMTAAMKQGEPHAAWPLFTPDALSQIVTAAGGQPAGILRRCEAAQLAASLHDTTLIDGQLVDEAHQHLFDGAASR